MLQRLQTLFLLFIALAMFTFLFLPIWHKVDPISCQSYTMCAWRLQAIDPTNNQIYSLFMPYLLIGVLASVVILVALYELICYDNRGLQLKLGALNSLCMTGIMGLIVYLAVQNEAKLLTHVTGHYKPGFVLAVIAVVSNLIANQLIKRDEKLAKSIESIR